MEESDDTEFLNKRKDSTRFSSFRRHAKLSRKGSRTQQKQSFWLANKSNNIESLLHSSHHAVTNTKQQTFRLPSFRRKANSVQHMSTIAPPRYQSMCDLHHEEKMSSAKGKDSLDKQGKGNWLKGGIFSRRKCGGDVDAKSTYISMSPQEYLTSTIQDRGYSTKRISSLHSGYFREPTELQEASWKQYVLDLVMNNDIGTLHKMFFSGISSNPSTYFGVTLAHFVSKFGSVEILKLMMEYGCDVRVADSNGRTPLHEACDRADHDYHMIDIIAKQDAGLFYMEDVTGKVPLEYVPAPQWSEWNHYLQSRSDILWPRRDVMKVMEQDDLPVTHTEPISDPSTHTHTIPISKVQLIASGQSVTRGDSSTATTASETKESQTVQEWWNSMNASTPTSTEASAATSNRGNAPTVSIDMPIELTHRRSKNSPTASSSSRSSNVEKKRTRSNATTYINATSEQVVGEIVCIMDECHVFEQEEMDEKVSTANSKDLSLDTATHERKKKKNKNKVPPITDANHRKASKHKEDDNNNNDDDNHDDVEFFDDISLAGSEEDGSDDAIPLIDMRAYIQESFEINIDPDTDSVSTMTQKKRRHNDPLFPSQRLLL